MPVGEALGPAAICGTVVSGGGAVVPAAVGPPGPPGPAGPAVGVPAVLRDGPADGCADAEVDGAPEARVDGCGPVESAGEGSVDAGEPAAVARPPQPSEPPRAATGVPFSLNAPPARIGPEDAIANRLGPELIAWPAADSCTATSGR